MRILLSSLSLLLLVACASYSQKQGFLPSGTIATKTLNPYFSDPDIDYLYKAKVAVCDKTLGGILIIKKLAPENHRVVFTTELGNTIFDFEFQGKTFIIHRILPEMDKKLLINVLKHDFSILIQEKPDKTNFYTKQTSTITEAMVLSKKHYYFFDDGQLKKIVRTANGKEKVAFLFSGINDNIAQEIIIEHQNIPLKIRLDAIKK